MKFVLSFLLLATSLFAGNADLVLKGGTLITMEKELPQAGALAVQSQKIVWVGKTEDADKWIGERTKVIDLKGAFVYPGFIESHAHIVSLGSSRLEIDLNEVPDVAAVAKLVKERVAKAKKGDWILGRGWDQNLWPGKQFPTAADLDADSPENPVSLERTDGHALWANSVALKLAAITAETKDPQGGKIIRDAKGNPTGVLVDTAADILYAKMKALTKDEEIQRTEITLKEAVQKGVTTVTDAGSSEADIEAWKAMAERNELPARIYSMVWMPAAFGEAYLKSGPKTFGPYFEMRSLKLVVDGAMGSRGAALLEPYLDDPSNTGLLMWKEDELMRVLKAAKAAGIQVGIHAIGDRANRMVLDAYERIGVKDLRWRIEHAQMLALSDIPRFSKIDVIASMQPIHATADMGWTPDRIGPERMKGSYAWQSLLKNGVRIAGGSDAPVEDMNPLWGIYAAITRQDKDGKPEGGWLPQEKVSREEALKMYTVDAAYTMFHENDLGSIREGKLADLVVLPQNLLTCEPKSLIDMKVLYTIVGGQIRKR